MDNGNTSHLLVLRLHHFSPAENIHLTESHMTRILTMVAIIGVTAFVFAENREPAQAKTPKDTCVQPCYVCANDCLACMKHCRENKMEHLAIQCEISHHACLACGLAVSHKNGQSWAICETCEKVCNECAAECDKATSEQAKKCAASCKACAKACADARK